jgi:hypothetical protein
MLADVSNPMAIYYKTCIRKVCKVRKLLRKELDKLFPIVDITTPNSPSLAKVHDTHGEERPRERGQGMSH